MIHTAKIGSATLTFDIDATGERADLENEGQGNATLSITVGTIRRVVPVGFQTKQQSLAGEIASSLVDQLCDSEGATEDDIRGSDYEDGNIIHCSDADACIVFMALAAERGEDMYLDWQSDGSAFWLLHDIEHARTDAWIDLDNGTGGIGTLDGSAEEAATVQAARVAIETRLIPPSEVLIEIVDNFKPFEDRFGYEPTTLEDVLGTCTLSIKED